MFVLGRTNLTARGARQLKAEQARFRDLVQHDFVDSYNNLTVKMVTALHWAAAHCPGAKFILKADEVRARRTRYVEDRRGEYVGVEWLD